MSGSDLALGLAVGVFVAIVAHSVIGVWRYLRRVNQGVDRLGG